jgi:hypothetical protein
MLTTRLDNAFATWNRCTGVRTSCIALLASAFLGGCGAMLSAMAPYHHDVRGAAALSALGNGITALEAAEASRSEVNVYSAGR